jgi:hypothetical protein
MILLYLKITSINRIVRKIQQFAICAKFIDWQAGRCNVSRARQLRPQKHHYFWVFFVGCERVGHEACEAERKQQKKYLLAESRLIWRQQTCHPVCAQVRRNGWKLHCLETHTSPPSDRFCCTFLAEPDSLPCKFFGSSF